MKKVLFGFRICSAIEAFSQHAKKEEEARGKRTSALAQAWALHLATLDKLESEIRFENLHSSQISNKKWIMYYIAVILVCIKIRNGINTQ